MIPHAGCLRNLYIFAITHANTRCLKQWNTILWLSVQTVYSDTAPMEWLLTNQMSLHPQNVQLDEGFSEQ